MDRFDGTAYRRLIFLGRTAILVEVRQVGPVTRPRLEVTLQGKAPVSAAAREAALKLVGTALGAALDVRPYYREFRNDALLGKLLRSFRGLRIAGCQSLWEAIVTAVLSQQINLVFAYDVRRELALAFGGRARFAGETYVAFPTARRFSRLSESKLRGFRLSGAKADTLLRLAEEFATGHLSEHEIRSLSDEKAIARLTAIKGVGRWTAEIALLRGQGRPDIFPGGDLGVVKYLATDLLGHQTPVTEAAMRNFAERWRPYRGLALMYAYAEINRRKSRSIARP